MNPWLVHVDKYRAKHPRMDYKDVLKNAKLTYKRPSKRMGVSNKIIINGGKRSDIDNAISSIGSVLSDVFTEPIRQYERGQLRNKAQDKRGLSYGEKVLENLGENLLDSPVFGTIKSIRKNKPLSKTANLVNPQLGRVFESFGVGGIPVSKNTYRRKY